MGYYNRIAGYIDAVRPDLSVDKDVNGGNRYGGRVAVTIAPNDRLVMTFVGEKEGERGQETIITLTFEALGDRTRMHFVQAPFDTVENRDSHRGGWSECFDRLGAYLKVAA